MYNIMIESKVKDSSNKKIKPKDLHFLQTTDDAKINLVENSKVYNGYKLLWTIQLLVEGKKYPSGKFSDE
jgi:hypothetical protein